MPHTLVEGCEQVPVNVKNLTDRTIYLRKNTVIGIGTSVEEVYGIDITGGAEVRHIKTDEHNSSVMPPHLQDLLKRSKTHLDEEQIDQLGQLMVKFQNTFSKNDLDIGHFTKIEYRVDTADVLHTKEGIRRTPLGFEKEEEEHLQDLLNKGVIQPSSSEWAAASVICRKKDGKIRYSMAGKSLEEELEFEDCCPWLGEEDKIDEEIVWMVGDEADGGWQVVDEVEGDEVKGHGEKKNQITHQKEKRKEKLGRRGDQEGCCVQCVMGSSGTCVDMQLYTFRGFGILQHVAKTVRPNICMRMSWINT